MTMTATRSGCTQKNAEIISSHRRTSSNDRYRIGGSEPLTAQASKTGAINAIQSSPIGTQSHRGIDRPADCRLASRRMATTANHRTAKSGECSRSQSKTMRLQSLVIVRGSNNQRLAEHMNV